MALVEGCVKSTGSRSALSEAIATVSETIRRWPLDLERRRAFFLDMIEETRRLFPLNEAQSLYTSRKKAIVLSSVCGRMSIDRQLKMFSSDSLLLLGWIHLNTRLILLFLGFLVRLIAVLRRD